RALAAELKLLILDEPTSSLTPAEAEKLFQIVRDLRDSGTSVIFITHRLEELALVADAVTILRDGRHVLTRPAAELSHAEIVRAWSGAARGHVRQAREAETRTRAPSRRTAHAGRRVLERHLFAAGGRDRRHGRACRLRRAVQSRCLASGLPTFRRIATASASSCR